MELSSDLTDWLLDSDPSLRWQVERDLLDQPSEVWRATRARVATEGFGAELRAKQDADGQWAGGAYFPKPPPEDEPGQPWTATTWSLNALREWGLDASVLGDTAERLAANSRWEYDDLPYWGGEVDACINGYTLANGAWLGADESALRQWFLEHQLADGGWNCEWVNGATTSSTHSTINSMTGLLDYEDLTGPDPELDASRRRAEEWLLERRLMYRLSTGELLPDGVTEFEYPFRWRYTVLRALDYFRRSDRRDDRLVETLDVVRSKQQPDGRWLQNHRLPGRVWFEVDAPVGEPSRWLTLYALRVLRWWDRS